MSGLDIDSFGRRTLQRRRQLARLLADDPVPALVRAYDVDPGGHLVTEHVPRVTVEDLLCVAPLPAAAALDVLRDVAEELRVMAAETGEAHGDVKPWNVLVLPGGHATIADPHPVDGPAGPPVGPPAPATRRGDAYWFAVLACELLTGTRPIDRADAACLMSRTRHFPAAARDAILRGLNPHPQRRPLPHTLVAALDEIPDAEWSGRVRTRIQSPGPTVADDATVDQATADPATADPVAIDAVAANAVAIDPVATAPTSTPLVAPILPAPGPEEAPAPAGATSEPEPCDFAPRTVLLRGVRTAPRKPFLRRLGPYVATLGVLLVMAGAAAGAWLLRLDAATAEAAATPVGVKKVSLTVTPPQTHCPLARVHLSASVVTDGSQGDVTVSWRLPGRTWLPDKRVEVAAGEKEVRATLDITVAGQRRLEGQAVVVVRPGGERATTPFRYDCDPARSARPAGRTGPDG